MENILEWNLVDSQMASLFCMRLLLVASIIFLNFGKMQVGVCNCIDMLVDGMDTYKHCIHTKDRCKRKVGKMQCSVLQMY